MIKTVVIQDFFSFKGKTEIDLNPGINLLLGINGSGKTSFINALRVLHEGIAGEGLVKLFQEQWGGFDQIANFNGSDTAQYAQLTFVFDKDKLNEINPIADFKTDVHYCITINRSGTSYALNEEVFAKKCQKRRILQVPSLCKRQWEAKHTNERRGYRIPGVYGFGCIRPRTDTETD